MFRFSFLILFDFQMSEEWNLNEKQRFPNLLLMIIFFQLLSFRWYSWNRSLPSFLLLLLLFERWRKLFDVGALANDCCCCCCWFRVEANFVSALDEISSLMTVEKTDSAAGSTAFSYVTWPPPPPPLFELLLLLLFCWRFGFVLKKFEISIFFRLNKIKL